MQSYAVYRRVRKRFYMYMEICNGNGYSMLGKNHIINNNNYYYTIRTQQTKQNKNTHYRPHKQLFKTHANQLFVIQTAATSTNVNSICVRFSLPK